MGFLFFSSPFFSPFQSSQKPIKTCSLSHWSASHLPSPFPATQRPRYRKHSGTRKIHINTNALCSPFITLFFHASTTQQPRFPRAIRNHTKIRFPLRSLHNPLSPPELVLRDLKTSIYKPPPSLSHDCFYISNNQGTDPQSNKKHQAFTTRYQAQQHKISTSRLRDPFNKTLYPLEHLYCTFPQSSNHVQTNTQPCPSKAPQAPKKSLHNNPRPPYLSLTLQIQAAALGWQCLPM